MKPGNQYINAFINALAVMGLKNLVICPGSRNAPLITSLIYHPDITAFSVVDERSAGFMALGMAKESGNPVAVCCTSGSALVNIYPAVTEAFYMQVPLLVISADRPPELIDKWDGQAIRQENIFGSHVRRSLVLSEESDIEQSFQIAMRAWQSAFGELRGPVHINIPVSEPLYEEAGMKPRYPEFTRPVMETEEKFNPPELDVLESAKGKKIMIVCGAGERNEEVYQSLLRIRKSGKAVVFCDIISGYHSCSLSPFWDHSLIQAAPDKNENLSPDILISIGKMVLSKGLKKLIRSKRPEKHVHICKSGFAYDQFFSAPEIIKAEEGEAFGFIERFIERQGGTNYSSVWEAACERSAGTYIDSISGSFTELNVFRTIIGSLQGAPELNLHLANSMAVRNAAFNADLIPDDWKIDSNRGVSGIDGCTSTAIGAAMAGKKNNILVSGDLAFFYDQNALFIQPFPGNLKIIVLNNSGGGIFSYLDGPAAMNLEKRMLETPHQYSAREVCSWHGIPYFRVDNFTDLNHSLDQFVKRNGNCLLEVFTSIEKNTEIFQSFKQNNI